MMSDVLFGTLLDREIRRQSYSELYLEHQEALKALQYSLEVIEGLQKVIERQNRKIEFLSNNTVLLEEE